MYFNSWGDVANLQKAKYEPTKNEVRVCLFGEIFKLDETKTFRSVVP